MASSFVILLYVQFHKLKIYIIQVAKQQLLEVKLEKFLKSLENFLIIRNRIILLLGNVLMFMSSSDMNDVTPWWACSDRLSSRLRKMDPFHARLIATLGKCPRYC